MVCCVLRAAGVWSGDGAEEKVWVLFTLVGGCGWRGRWERWRWGQFRYSLQVLHSSGLTRISGKGWCKSCHSTLNIKKQPSLN